MLDIIFNLLSAATKIFVTSDFLHRLVVNFLQNPHFQIFFNESKEKQFTLLFDSWTTDRIVVLTSKHQLDEGSSVKSTPSKFLIAAHQTVARFRVANKANILSVFDQVDVGIQLSTEIEFYIQRILLKSTMLPIIISINTDVSKNLIKNMPENYHENYLEQRLILEKISHSSHSSNISCKQRKSEKHSTFRRIQSRSGYCSV